MPRVLYLAHDLSDPAVRRRVAMLKAGGATVVIAGFRRGARAPEAIEGIKPIDLGLTMDGKFVQRTGAVARAVLSLKHLFRQVEKPDLIIGRNVEMLAVAHRANSVFGGDVPIVYECLDIHRLLLRSDVIGSMVRNGEAYFGREARLIMTSSPAFIDHYFRPLSKLGAPIMLVENKVISIDAADEVREDQKSPSTDGQPWKIGWFGALRCRKSLQLLADFSRAMEGRFEIVLRGRPAYSEFDDFDAFIANEPYLSFHGAYKNPEELPEIYGDVHFCWTIDFFEEGLNSSWLLPNRLYEGCLYGAVPIALEGTETARFLAREKIGLRLKEATHQGLIALLSRTNAITFRRLRDDVRGKDEKKWVANRSDCVTFVRQLMEMSVKERQREESRSLFSRTVMANGDRI